MRIFSAASSTAFTHTPECGERGEKGEKRVSLANERNEILGA